MTQANELSSMTPFIVVIYKATFIQSDLQNSIVVSVKNKFSRSGTRYHQAKTLMRMLKQHENKTQDTDLGGGKIKLKIDK